MRRFMRNEISDIERRMCELAEEYTDNWKDEYFEKVPKELDESGVNEDLDEYNRLMGERTAFYKMRDFLKQNTVKEYEPKDGSTH